MRTRKLTQLAMSAAVTGMLSATPFLASCSGNPSASGDKSEKNGCGGAKAEKKTDANGCNGHNGCGANKKQEANSCKGHNGCNGTEKKN
ncbi:MAG: hypothetical protein JNJ88_04705 [Planctomycetes bacterium]|nr:hypothetical protein [Planctomycetota bacterium]